MIHPYLRQMMREDLAGTLSFNLLVWLTTAWIAGGFYLAAVLGTFLKGMISQTFNLLHVIWGLSLVLACLYHGVRETPAVFAGTMLLSCYPMHLRNWPWNMYVPLAFYPMNPVQWLVVLVDIGIMLIVSGLRMTLIICLHEASHQVFRLCDPEKCRNIFMIVLAITYSAVFASLIVSIVYK